MKIEWQEYLSVGVAEIDAQHRQLFDRFNAFLGASEAGQGGDEVSRLFSFLDSYVATHFADEERFQQQIGFPDLPQHREQHLAFLGQLAELKERLHKDGPSRSLVTSTSVAMTGWLIDHIAKLDRAIGLFAREREKAGAR
jgi:hemerythrin